MKAMSRELKPRPTLRTNYLKLETKGLSYGIDAKKLKRISFRANGNKSTDLRPPPVAPFTVIKISKWRDGSGFRFRRIVFFPQFTFAETLKERPAKSSFF